MRTCPVASQGSALGFFGLELGDCERVVATAGLDVRYGNCPMAVVDTVNFGPSGLATRYAVRAVLSSATVTQAVAYASLLEIVSSSTACGTAVVAVVDYEVTSDVSR